MTQKGRLKNTLKLQVWEFKFKTLPDSKSFELKTHSYFIIIILLNSPVVKLPIFEMQGVPVSNCINDHLCALAQGCFSVGSSEGVPDPHKSSVSL